MRGYVRFVGGPLHNKHVCIPHWGQAYFFQGARQQQQCRYEPMKVVSRLGTVFVEYWCDGDHSSNPSFPELDEPAGMEFALEVSLTYLRWRLACQLKRAINPL